MEEGEEEEGAGSIWEEYAGLDNNPNDQLASHSSVVEASKITKAIENYLFNILRW